ncbi:RecBCD enzyme subunit RecD [Nocardioides aquaticus]|uniref:RecBCD enzyme subunit RecD n=1 Tax=Nocardioides aquaticus TaxID=160826 RepID=A0ABX8ENI0_9ACTN|nr:DUF4011 domain-containing protein [Nocardioides aquaticus]QVT81490.1 RecBCD enzyme subunit RecD [Nocardioides aquaticus]
MPSEPRTLTPELERRLATQVDAWRRDLLTLDRRQKLVYFKHTRTASIEVASPGAAALFERVSRPLLVAADEENTPRDAMVVAGKTAAETVAACRRLDLNAQQVYADRGFWTLYLGIGMLRWVDPADGKAAEAPVVLCPVTLKRAGSQSPYFVSRNEDDVVVNPALRLHLENTFSISLPDVDLDDPDPRKVMSSLRQSVAGRADWSVDDRAVMTTFSFHKEAIYRDLMDHESHVVSHPVVQLVALGADAPHVDAFSFTAPGSSGNIDEERPPEMLHSILDADSSQRACIIAARDGRSFVMDGPPGTGKSQTIANIVAELIADGKRVLFVSEKAAALDVVRDRLSGKGLGDFTFELHSHAATRREVVRQLNEALTRRSTARGAFTEGERHTLQRTRSDLSGWAAAVNEVRPGLGRSLFEVLGRLVELDQVEHRPHESPAEWLDLTPTRLDDLLDTAGRLSRAWRPARDGDDFLWRDLAVSQHSRAQIDEAGAATAALADEARALAMRSRSVDEDLALSWPTDERSARTRLALLEALEARPVVPPHWLTRPDLRAVLDRAAQLERAVDEHDRSTTGLAEVVGADGVDRIDPDACAAVTGLEDLGAVVLWSPAPSTTSTDLDAAVDFLRESPIRLAQVVEDARQIGSMLGIPTERVTMRRAVELGHLAALGGSSALPERAWLNPAVQAALQESMRALSSVVELVRERRQAVEEVFTTEALNTDLHALEVRFRDSHTGLRAFSAAARADKKLLRSISVSGRSDKSVRARLPEAVAWRRAEAALWDTEQEHSGRLGSYYQRTATDFGRLGDALETARRAVELAGNDLNGGPMGDQLSRDGNPDPRLTVVSQRLLSAAGSWSTDAARLLGEEVSAGLQDLPVDVAADRAQDTFVALEPVGAAVRHVSVAAGGPRTVEQAVLVHAHSIRLASALVKIYDSYSADQELLGDLYQGLATDWGDMRKALDWTTGVRDLLGGAALDRQAERMLKPVVLSSDLRASLETFGRALDRWSVLFEGSRALVLRAEVASDLGDGVTLLDDMHRSHVTDINEWDAYETLSRSLAQSELQAVVRHLVRSRTDATAVPGAIEWTVLQAWTEAVVASDERLVLSRSADRDSLVEKFRNLDRDQVGRANISVAAACSARRPSSVTGSSVQLIRREAQKKTRHLPIRDLLARTHEIVQELKPCFMMSPLSVSQFLPGDMTFDTVIFDEASQVLPSDAINCIYRAGQLIVAGDEKQLPPTSFFAQAVSDEDVDEDLDLFECVLKSCKSSLPSLPLTWHYRSQHESLITYSNYRFYTPDGDALQTFPGATYSAPDLGVESYVVNGVYQRGSSRDNPVEAEAVVDRVLFHRQQHPHLSIGVVTFSSAQENAIAAALERRSLSEPSLAGLLDDHDRLNGFFVKNLENVQGDERDIIVFSIGYGPDDQGRFTMNFGPVGRQGGWRRLNVAITRARRRVEVVTSFRAGEMREGSNESLAHLRGYLDFAERGPSALGIEDADDGRDDSDALVRDVVAEISSWGYDVSTKVGSAAYRVDIAVRHPDRPGEYVVGIECDGPTYRDAASARDRDRLRESVLRGLGWRLHRVWAVAWYRDRRQESARLRQAIDAAISGGSGTNLPEAPAPVALETEEVDLDAAPDWAVPYRAFLRSPGGPATPWPRSRHDLRCRPTSPRCWPQRLRFTATCSRSGCVRRSESGGSGRRSGRTSSSSPLASRSRASR